VLKAQLLTLPATISTSANGVVTTQLSFRPPASSRATEVAGSSDNRPATAQPPEPAPTTTKSNVSVTPVSPSLFIVFVCASASGANPRVRE
jgi:heme-binding NEAT domain protein